MIRLLLCLTQFVVLNIGVASTEPEPTESEFALDSYLVDSLYKETTSEVAVSSDYALSSFQVTPQLSMVSPNAFALSNRYFDVSYTDNLQNLPVFHLAVSAPLMLWGQLSVVGQGRLGYSYKEGLFQVHSKISGLRTDSVKLHWVPLSGGLKFEYSFPGAAFLRPSISLGGGAEWLYQMGRLDGMEQGFWIPFYTFTPGFTVFDDEGIRDWFGGITFSGTYQSSFSSDQLIRGWSIDIGLNVLL